MTKTIPSNNTMKSSKDLFVAVLVLAVITTLMSVSSVEGCKCVNRYAGKHCGRSPFMSGCKANNIYQCNGVYNSAALNYGLCAKGCQYGSLSKDYCQK